MPFGTCRPAPLVAAALSLVTLVISGCGLPESTWIRREPVVARNDAGESVSIALRLYQLDSWESFREAAFDDLWTDPAGVLGDQLQAEPTVFTVRPNALPADQIEIEPFALPEWESDTRYLGLLLLSPEAPRSGARRAIMAARDAASWVIVVQDGAIRLEDR